MTTTILVRSDTAVLKALHQLGVDLMALSAAQIAQHATILGILDVLGPGLRADIQALKDAIVNGPGEDPAVTAAFNAITLRLAPLQMLDAENPVGSVPPVPPIDGL
jgi:hypothetical protein